MLCIVDAVTDSFWLFSGSPDWQSKKNVSQEQAWRRKIRDGKIILSLQRNVYTSWSTTFLPYILSHTILTVAYLGPRICFVRTTYLSYKDHLSFCGFITTAYLSCKDHLSFCGFIRTASSCCKDHLYFFGFIWTAYFCCKDHLSFFCLKEPGCPTKTTRWSY